MHSRDTIVMDLPELLPSEKARAFTKDKIKMLKGTMIFGTYVPKNILFLAYVDNNGLNIISSAEEIYGNTLNGGYSKITVLDVYNPKKATLIKPTNP